MHKSHMEKHTERRVCWGQRREDERPKRRAMHLAYLELCSLGFWTGTGTARRHVYANNMP